MEEQLKKEWQEFVESQVWQGEDEFTKNMGVGNVADWWIEKFSSRQISLIKMIVEEIVNKVEVKVYDERISEDVVDIVEKIVKETKDTISSKLKELIKE